MTKINKRIALSLGLILLLLASAFSIPIIIDSTEDPETITLHQEEQIIHTVKSPLTSTITVINGSNNNIDIVLYNEETGDSTRLTGFSEGATTNVTLSGEEITITYKEFISNSNIVLSYEIPVYFGWNEGIKTIFNNIAFIMVFTLILFIIGIILVMLGVFE